MGGADKHPPDASRLANEADDEGEQPASDAARLQELESRFDQMARLNQRLERRLRELEDAPQSGRARPEEPVPGEAASTSGPAPERRQEPAPLISGLPEGFGGWATLAGRVFLILGGAYLLRALAESGTLAFPTAVALAACYALLWLAVAHRGTARRSHQRTAYGLAFVLVAFPLVVENTARFHLLSPSEGALALGVAVALGLRVVWKHRLRVLGWILLLGAISAIAMAALHTQAWPPWMLLFVAVGLGVDWVAAHHKWAPARAFAAGATDLALLFYLPIIVVDRAHYTPTATLVELSLFVGYMGSYALGSLAERRSLGIFERVQLAAVLLVGYVGAVLGALEVPSVSVPLGWVSVVAGVAGFAAAYFLYVLPAKSPVDAWFNTSYALVGVLVGTWVLLAVPAYAWIGIAILLTLIGTGDRHACLALDGAVFAVFAALGSGLLGAVGYAFAAPATHWPDLSTAAIGALAALAFAYLAPLHSEATRSSFAGRLTKTLSLAALVAGLDALVVTAVVPTGSGGMSAAWLAALRTGMIAGSALVLAALSRIDRFREARALVYPILVLGGVKILVEDLRNGRALTLFIACALYGGALIVAPRLRRRVAPENVAPPGD